MFASKSAPMDLCDLPAHVLVDRLKRGEISAAAILDSVLTRIEAVEGRPPSLDYEPDSTQRAEDLTKVHAYISIQREAAQAHAAEIDCKLADGEDPGPLAGIPLAVKDIFCVKGTPSTAASRILANFVAPYTATAARRLEAAGAITLGKVNLDEFTYGSSNESSAFRPVVGNPWNTAKVPGGSSGGSAAAVGAGEAILSLGTDTSGSIRQPAAFCGVVGVKPTYGRVSRYGLIAFASSLDCVGPITRDVWDAALMLKVMAGPDPCDATSAAVLVPDYTARLDGDVRGLRIGLSPDYFRLRYPEPGSGILRDAEIDPQIKSAVLHAAETLGRAGAEIVEDVPMPNTHNAIPAYFVISRVEAASNLHRYDGVKYGYRHPGQVTDLREMYRKTRAEAFGPQPKLRILMGMYVSAAQYSEQYYQRALRVRTLIRRDFEAIFDKTGRYRLDCLLTPTTPTTAFDIGAVYGDSVLMQYADLLTVPADHAGIPGISVPGGLDRDSMPIGVQFLTSDFDEETMLRVAYAYEQLTAAEPWRMVRPRVVESIP